MSTFFIKYSLHCVTLPDVVSCNYDRIWNSDPGFNFCKYINGKCQIIARTKWLKVVSIEGREKHNRTSACCKTITIQLRQRPRVKLRSGILVGMPNGFGKRCVKGRLDVWYFLSLANRTVRTIELSICYFGHKVN